MRRHEHAGRDVFRRRELELDVRWDVVSRCLDHAPRKLDAVARLDRDSHPLRLQAAHPEDVVDDARKAVGLARDHLEQTGPLWLAEQDVLAAECQGSAIDGGERRAELMRDRGDEIGLQRLDRTLFGQVPERVDAAVVETDSRDREPELPVVDLHRLCRRP